jgi:hypothetical protein
MFPPNPYMISECPRCGELLVAIHVRQSGGNGLGHDVLTVILAGTGTTAAIFLKTIAEESAKDIYAFLKERTKRGDAVDPDGRDIAGLLESPTRPRDGIRIVDEQNRLTVELPSQLPDETDDKLILITESVKPAVGSWVVISYRLSEWKVMTYRLIDPQKNNQE